MKWLAAIAVLAGCSSSSSGTGDVVGPFTGPVHRYAMTSIALPLTSDDTHAFGDDLDGDGRVDNKLGSVTAVLAGTMDVSANAPDMIASGALASFVEIQANSLQDDGSVGVRYLGADGDDAVAAGGRLVAGAFRSNRTRDTRAPGRARVRLPVFTNADPIDVELDGLEVDLDPDGSGGFDATARGAIPAAAALDAAYAGLLQMIADEPQRHLVFARLLDANHDGQLSRDELDASVIALLAAPDVALYDGTQYAPHAGGTKDSVSVGFRVHLAPCPAGSCAIATPADACRDRVRDGDETDVDCGGSCQPCAPAAACLVAGDCQTGACDAGHCRAASCSDGVRDGLETDVDCGDDCTPCAAGQVCVTASDCASGQCPGATGSTGACAP